jgi:hypothetical protein
MARTTDSDRFREIRVDLDGIVVRFEEAEIDTLALEFCKALEGHKVAYAIVGGYMAIPLGRPRESEDVDILGETLDFDRFLSLHTSLMRGFDCHAPGSARRLFSDYLDAGRESTALRYAKKGTQVPNVEFKFAFKPLDRRAVRKRMPIDVNGKRIFAGPLGMQIGYKLWMNGEKDFEDARWMYRVAEGRLDETEIWGTAGSLGVTEAEGRRILGAR